VVTACLDDVRICTAGCAATGVGRPPGSDGLKSLLMCLDQARYGINWSTLVGAISCYDTALQYLLLRK
jgi:alkylation response protein AidB-like acyl-CoA dehydrogenase